MAFTAVFDACVLYPAPLRDLLVQLGLTRLFRMRWTDRIQDEWQRNLIAKRPELDPARIKRTATRMNEASADCLITGYEPLIEAVTLPDPQDRHVVAAAIAGRADVIVTLNLKHFPAPELARFQIEPQHPDVFIRSVLELDLDAIAAVALCRNRLKNPPLTAEQYLDTLLRQGLPETVSYLRQWAELI